MLKTGLEMNSDSRSFLPCETGSEYVWTCWLSRLGLRCAHLWTLTVSSSPFLDVQREEHQLAWLRHAAALRHRQVPRRGVCMLPVGWGKRQRRLCWRRGRRLWRLVGWSRHWLHRWRVRWLLSGWQRGWTISCYSLWILWMIFLFHAEKIPSHTCCICI